MPTLHIIYKAFSGANRYLSGCLKPICKAILYYNSRENLDSVYRKLYINKICHFCSMREVNQHFLKRDMKCRPELVAKSKSYGQSEIYNKLKVSFTSHSVLRPKTQICFFEIFLKFN